jgi:hypothetical protein
LTVRLEPQPLDVDIDPIALPVARVKVLIPKFDLDLAPLPEHRMTPFVPPVFRPIIPGPKQLADIGE